MLGSGRQPELNVLSAGKEPQCFRPMRKWSCAARRSGPFRLVNLGQIRRFDRIDRKAAATSCDPMRRAS